MIVITFLPSELEQIHEEAKKKDFRRRNTWMPEITPEKFFRQQLCGQLGDAALSKMLFGTIDMYLEGRRLANLDKYKGDDGDIPGLPLDIKTSWASCGWDYDYQLWVPGYKYKPHMNYILGLVPKSDFASVRIVGWKRGCDLMPDPIPGNEGRMGISMYRLNDLDFIIQEYGYSLEVYETIFSDSLT